MKEIIVVGLYNTPNRNNEYTYIYDPTEMMGGVRYDAIRMTTVSPR